MPKSRSIKAPTGASEVDYSGVTFRSRLEARWALLFDLAGWDWDYEPANYQVGVKSTYQPDFYLLKQKLWVEVKGEYWLTGRSLSKMSAAVAGPKPIPLRSHPYGPARQIILLGEILAPTKSRIPTHTLIAQRAGEMRADVSDSMLTDCGASKLNEPWMQLDASGRMSSRKVPPKTADRLCRPPLQVGELKRQVANAYIVAAATKGQGRSLGLIPDIQAIVNNRRGGRPI